MEIANNETKHNIYIHGKILEQVRRFNYLETIIDEKGTMDEEINERIGKI